MGRLKKDHSGWSTMGKWKKYQQPTINDAPRKPKSKKNTNKWCRGKVGIKHDWHRYQDKRYNWDIDGFVWSYEKIKCASCKKENYIKKAKSIKYPYHLWVDYTESGYTPIQVRVNGKYRPIDLSAWCEQCGYCH